MGSGFERRADTLQPDHDDPDALVTARDRKRPTPSFSRIE
jgi:hypothetical protein